MTRFQKSLRGELGNFWQEDAKRQLKYMTDMFNNFQLLVDDDGAAYWASNGRYVPDDVLDVVYTALGDIVNPEVTHRKHEMQVTKELEEYRSRPHPMSQEDLAEMRAAFGAGSQVVDIITGETITL